MSANLRPLIIGGLRIDFPFVLAPLAGYTDAAYRLICRSCSAEYTATGVMLDKLLLVGSKLRRQIVLTDPADHPSAGQIMGSDPAVMAKAARVMVETGFDVVDLNFACPVRKVLARRRGGWLMQDPVLALSIIREVVAAVAGEAPVTIKLRRAYKESDTENRAFWKIAEGAFGLGVAAIAVHARSVESRYTGRADHAFLAAVKKAFPDRTVIGSGDALTPERSLQMLASTGVDGVAVARGAIGDPWIFEGIRALAAGQAPEPPAIGRQRKLIMEHYELERRFFGDEKAWRRMRNFGIMYARKNPHPRDVRMAFVAVKSIADWFGVMDRYYGPADT